ncbi:MAG: hypothetical protein DRJ60_00355 [Thermoprotei archaeon]|nr:MAG: hypothetical protein DRJ60_00355 [Thermoprotei archaeon]
MFSITSKLIRALKPYANLSVEYYYSRYKLFTFKPKSLSSKHKFKLCFCESYQKSPLRPYQIDRKFNFVLNKQFNPYDSTFIILATRKPTRGAITLARKTKGLYIFWGQDYEKRILNLLFSWFSTRLRRLGEAFSEKDMSVRDSGLSEVQDLYLMLTAVVTSLGAEYGLTGGDIFNLT